MALSIAQMQILVEFGALYKGCRVLDLGAQNLNAVEPDEFVYFVNHHNPVYDLAALTKYAQAVAELSSLDPEYGQYRRGAWLGDLLVRAGMSYTAFDIFEQDGVVLFDLNVDSLSAEYCSAFDVCLNFGTTEHVLNQLNCLKVIHEALRPGGVFYHCVPLSGCFDHGYFSYNPTLFEALSVYNGYQVLDCWVDTDVGANFSAAFANRYPKRTGFKAAGVTVPVNGLHFIGRKTHDQPFRVPFDSAAAAGEVLIGNADIEKSALDMAPGAQLERVEGALRYANDPAEVRELNWWRFVLLGRVLQLREIPLANPRAV